jgi:hypothetical protein
MQMPLPPKLRSGLPGKTLSLLEESKLKRTLVLACCTVALYGSLTWAGPTPPAAQTVDSGTFGIYQGGKRVGSEKFTVQQSSDGSQVSAELQMATGEHQTSLLDLTPGGDIRRYEFKELSPGKTAAVLAPKDDFLAQQITTGPEDKPIEQKYVLTAATNVLDDFVFVHREVLVWRYLATACKQDRGALKCPQQKTPMGAVVPHGRTSMQVALEFTGREKISIQGQMRDLNHLNLTGDWQLWVDDSLKLVRMVVPDQGTEILRD